MTMTATLSDKTQCDRVKAMDSGLFLAAAFGLDVNVPHVG